MSYKELDFQHFQAEFARKKKPSGKKEDRTGPKLPNQIRHDQNASIAHGTWGKRRGKNDGRV